MHLLQLRTQAEPAEVKRMIGKPGKPSDFGILLTETGTVFKPNGQRLITLIRGGFSEDSSTRAYPFLHWLRRCKTMNRGAYSGEVRYKQHKRDGTFSNTNQAKPMRSAIAGHFDRYPRFPFCRETAFSTQRPEDWKECIPLIQEVARTFKKYVPDRYEKQLEVAKKTHPAYVIPETPYTTITVNNCASGAYHLDAGDYEPGFGCMTVMRRGQYKGCLLGFPAFGVAVDLQDRDLILFDPHEVHGNTPFYDTVGEEGEDWERISVIYYFRKKMTECLSPREELARAKSIRGAEFELPTMETENADA